jgi:hypothetical protein
MLASAAFRSAVSASPQLRKAVSVASATAFGESRLPFEDAFRFPDTADEVVQPVTASAKQAITAAITRLRRRIMAL